LYLIAGLIFALLVAIFAVQNAQPVPVRFLVWGLEVPLALVIVGMAAAGGLLVGLTVLVRQVGLGFRLWNARAEHRRLEGERRQLEERLQTLKTELEELREENTRLRGVAPAGATEPEQP